jgi:predicted nucleotidyltransferase
MARRRKRRILLHFLFFPLAMPKRTDLESIKRIVAAHKGDLQRRYHLTALGVFGSYTRGEETATSDVDILIDYDPASRLNLFDIVELKDELSALLGVKADVVTKPALKRWIGEHILQEVQYV